MKMAEYAVELWMFLLNPSNLKKIDLPPIPWSSQFVSQDEH